MSQIIKAFTGIVLVLFLMLTAMGILGAFLEVFNAQNIHAAMIDELENSDYAKSVLEECFEIAEETGYQLEIRLYSDSEAVTVCTGISNLPDSTQDVCMAEVELLYPFQIAFFDMKIEQRIFGYAR